MNENELVTRAAGTVGIYTLLSRVLGLVRDVLIAKFFGSGMSADAFFVAFRIPNLLRRLFAEGSFPYPLFPYSRNICKIDQRVTPFCWQGLFLLI